MRSNPKPSGVQLLGRLDRSDIHGSLRLISLAILYFTALVMLGPSTLRKGHTALFWFGILFPFLWILGALMAPTAKAQADY